MKTKSKALLMTLCAVLLVAASVLGTMAYLTSTTGEVKNTFSIGKIAITLDEARVNLDGQPVDKNNNVVADVDKAPRQTTNQYKLVPGHTYTKDPTVHVADENSENSWIFVKVENGIADIEAAGDTTIAKQIKDKGWMELTGVDGVKNVYYRAYDKTSPDKNFVVFDSFTVKNDVSEDSLKSYQTASITITAYAIQKDTNLDTAAEAWRAGQFK